MRGHLTADLTLERAGVGRAGHERMLLLKAIGDAGSISEAARRVGLSFRGAWDAVQCLNALAGLPVVEASPGGRNGGGAVLTAAGRRFLAAYESLWTELQGVVGRMQAHLDDGAPGLSGLDNLWTARLRSWRGYEAHLVTPGGSEIIAQPVGAIGGLDAAVDQDVRVAFPSQAVLLLSGDPRATSARNVWDGVVVGARESGAGVEVQIELQTRDILRSVVTASSAEALDLRPGRHITSLVKASQVRVEQTRTGG